MARVISNATKEEGWVWILNHLEYCPQVCPQLLLPPSTSENFALGLPLMRFEGIPGGLYVHIEIQALGKIHSR